MKIVDRDPTWKLERWHGVEGSPRSWRITGEGIFSLDVPPSAAQPGKLYRTKGEPATLTSIKAKFDLYDIARLTSGTFSPWLLKLMSAAIANESKGLDGQEKGEAHLNDRSIGVMQLLTATAKELARRWPTIVNIPTGDGVPPLEDYAQWAHRLAAKIEHVSKLTALPQGGPLEGWRTALHDHETSIALGTAYLVWIDQQFRCQRDPVLIYAAYNAGSPRVNLQNPWGMHYFRKTVVIDGKEVTFDAMNTFASWYGDACHVWGKNA